MPGEADAGEFLDTTVLVYAFTRDPRAAAAQALLGRDGVTSVQALNEFTDVARRKLGMSWQEVREALAAIRILCQTFVPLDIDTHADALRIAKRHLRCADDRGGAARGLRCSVLEGPAGRHDDRRAAHRRSVPRPMTYVCVTCRRAAPMGDACDGATADRP